MRQLWSIVVCLVLVLGLGLSEAPRPCHGDGHGGACALTTCSCDGACTCKLDHERERVVAQVEALAVCHDGGHADLAKLAASCHGAGSGPKFAPAQKPWTAALPVAMVGWRAPPAAPQPHPYQGRAAGRALAPLLRPPALLA